MDVYTSYRTDIKTKESLRKPFGHKATLSIDALTCEMICDLPQNENMYQFYWSINDISSARNERIRLNNLMDHEFLMVSFTIEFHFFVFSIA